MWAIKLAEAILYTNPVPDLKLKELYKSICQMNSIQARLVSELIVVIWEPVPLLCTVLPTIFIVFYYLNIFGWKLAYTTNSDGIGSSCTFQVKRIIALIYSNLSRNKKEQKKKPDLSLCFLYESSVWNCFFPKTMYFFAILPFSLLNHKSRPPSTLT